MSTKTERAIDTANDAVQTAATRDDAAAILKALPLAIVRGIADLNYCDYQAGRAVMTREILDCVFGD